MMHPLLGAIALLILGLLVVWAEVFIPSGGILTVIAGACLLGSIALAFTHGMAAGIVFLVLVVISAPTVFGVGMHYLSHTAIGRKFILMPPKLEDVDPATQHDRELHTLIGQVGRTISPHLPSGMTELGGRRVDTVAEGVGIDAGTLVRVIGVQGRRVVVRRLESNIGRW